MSCLQSNLHLGRSGGKKLEANYWEYFTVQCAVESCTLGLDVIVDRWD